MLRAEGFKGIGQTLRRINGPLIHVFNPQGARGSASFSSFPTVHQLMTIIRRRETPLSPTRSPTTEASCQ